jgi:hypothetical protein
VRKTYKNLTQRRTTLELVLTSFSMRKMNDVSWNRFIDCDSAIPINRTSLASEAESNIDNVGPQGLVTENWHPPQNYPGPWQASTTDTWNEHTHAPVGGDLLAVFQPLELSQHYHLSDTTCLANMIGSSHQPMSSLPSSTITSNPNPEFFHQFQTLPLSALVQQPAIPTEEASLDFIPSTAVSTFDSMDADLPSDVLPDLWSTVNSEGTSSQLGILQDTAMDPSPYVPDLRVTHDILGNSSLDIAILSTHPTCFPCENDGFAWIPTTQGFQNDELPSPLSQNPHPPDMLPTNQLWETPASNTYGMTLGNINHSEFPSRALTWRPKRDSPALKVRPLKRKTDKEQQLVDKTPKRLQKSENKKLSSAVPSSHLNKFSTMVVRREPRKKTKHACFNCIWNHKGVRSFTVFSYVSEKSSLNTSARIQFPVRTAWLHTSQGFRRLSVSLRKYRT